MRPRIRPLGRIVPSMAEPQPKGGSACSLCFSSSSTEHTEYLSDLCVEAVLSTEVTEILRKKGKISAALEEFGS